MPEQNLPGEPPKKEPPDSFGHANLFAVIESLRLDKARWKKAHDQLGATYDKDVESLGEEIDQLNTSKTTLERSLSDSQGDTAKLIAKNTELRNLNAGLTADIARASKVGMLGWFVVFVLVACIAVIVWKLK
jgi:hypothetical protein